MDCWPMRNFASADVDVRVAQGGQDLRHGDAVGFQFVRVHLDLKFLGRAAPTVDGRDAGNGQQAGAARSNPEPCADSVIPKCFGPTTW